MSVDVLFYGEWVIVRRLGEMGMYILGGMGLMGRMGLMGGMGLMGFMGTLVMECMRGLTDAYFRI